MHDPIPADVRREILERLSRAAAEHGVRIVLPSNPAAAPGVSHRPTATTTCVSSTCTKPRGTTRWTWRNAATSSNTRSSTTSTSTAGTCARPCGFSGAPARHSSSGSNPPITYGEAGVFRGQALAAVPAVYSAEKGIHHYLSMARTNYRGYLRQPLVPLKKYFYVLRPLLAARWIARSGQPAPIQFERLLVHLQSEPQVLSRVHRLLDEKRRSPELGLAPAVPELNAFAEAELDAPPPRILAKPDAAAGIAVLNRIFHAVLTERHTP